MNNTPRASAVVDRGCISLALVGTKVLADLYSVALPGYDLDTFGTANPCSTGLAAGG